MPKSPTHQAEVTFLLERLMAIHQSETLWIPYRLWNQLIRASDVERPISPFSLGLKPHLNSIDMDICLLKSQEQSGILIHRCENQLSEITEIKHLNEIQLLLWVFENERASVEELEEFYAENDWDLCMDEDDFEVHEIIEDNEDLEDEE